MTIFDAYQIFHEKRIQKRNSVSCLTDVQFLAKASLPFSSVTRATNVKFSRPKMNVVTLYMETTTSRDALSHAHNVTDQSFTFRKKRESAIYLKNVVPILQEIRQNKAAHNIAPLS